MRNIYFDKPERFLHETRIETVKSGDRTMCIAPAENIFRPPSGGQPQDRGTVLLGGLDIPVRRVFKDDGRTWLCLERPPVVEPIPGVRMLLRVDASHRERLSRAHSLVHVLMAAARNIVGGYESKGATISENGTSAELRFRSSEPLSDCLLKEVDVLGRYLISGEHAIRVVNVHSDDHPATRFGQWRIDPDLQLSGKIRIIDIVGVDQNPCSGSHVATTDSIGPYEIKSTRIDGHGVNLVTVALLNDWITRYGDRAIQMCTRADLSVFGDYRIDAPNETH